MGGAAKKVSKQIDRTINKASEKSGAIDNLRNNDMARAVAPYAAAYFTAGMASPLVGGVVGPTASIANVNIAAGAGGVAGYAAGTHTAKQLAPDMPAAESTGELTDGPETTPENADEVQVRSARRRQQAAQLAANGRQGTILSGSLGVPAGQQGQSRTILGG